MRKLFYFTTCLILLLIYSTDANAQKYKVKKGETLYEIARDNGVSVKDIKRANKISTSRIHPGDVIVISKKVQSERVKLTKAKAAKSIRSVEATGGGKPNLTPHIVENGETLYRIAFKFGTSVNEIKKINKLRGNSLKAGQKILVPAVENEEELPDAIEETVNETDIADADTGEEFQSEDENALENVLVKNDGANDEDRIVDNKKDKNWFSLIDKAIDYIGVPYRFGGSSLKGIDCSAFVQTVYKYFRIDLPRTAREQFKAGVKVSKKELQIGDLIFFQTYAKYPSHVGIYLGEGNMIHASSRDKKVTITSINEPYYIRRYIGAVRLPEDNLPNIAAEDIKSLAN